MDPTESTNEELDKAFSVASCTWTAVADALNIIGTAVAGELDIFKLKVPVITVESLEPSIVMVCLANSIAEASRTTS